MYNRYKHKRTLSGTDSRIYRIGRINTLSSQSGTFNLYLSEILGTNSAYTSDLRRFSEILYYTNSQIISYPGFVYNFSRRLEDLINSKTQTKRVYSQWYSSPHNTDYPKLVSSASKWLDADAKKYISTHFLNYYKNFSSGVKKEISRVLSDFVEINDPAAISVLRTFLRNIEPENVKKLLSKIPNGINNTDVQAVFKKTKMMEYLTFNESTFNSDPNERERVIKAIGRTPTLIKKLDFDVKLSLDDIKKIAPAMRFNFLQFVFKYELMYTGWGYVGERLKNHILKRKIDSKEKHLVVDDINIQDMKELLFSVCLKKNDSFSKWIESYIAYKEALDKKY